MEIAAKGVAHRPTVPKSFPGCARKTKGSAATNRLTLESIGRGGGIRTRDPLHPMQVRYQAALHPDEALQYSCDWALLERACECQPASKALMDNSSCLMAAMEGDNGTALRSITGGRTDAEDPRVSTCATASAASTADDN